MDFKDTVISMFGNQEYEKVFRAVWNHQVMYGDQDDRMPNWMFANHIHEKNYLESQARIYTENAFETKQYDDLVKYAKLLKKIHGMNVPFIYCYDKTIRPVNAADARMMMRYMGIAESVYY